MLIIKKEIYNQMIDYCMKCMPYEACGILAGKEMVTSIYKIKNMELSSVSYFMDPVEQLCAMKDIRTKNLQMLAIFHSHPCGHAYPSHKDIELAFYDVYHVIVALNPELEVRGFMISDNKIEEIKLIID